MLLVRSSSALRASGTAVGVTAAQFDVNSLFGMMLPFMMMAMMARAASSAFDTQAQKAKKPGDETPLV